MTTYYAKIVRTSTGLTMTPVYHTMTQTFGLNDTYGADGADGLLGKNHNAFIADRIHAKGGDDMVVSGYGADTVFGGSGDDLIADLSEGMIASFSGSDLFYGGTGDDVLSGKGGNDTLSGDEGNDRLFGDEGHDVLLGGTGADEMHGGLGSDVFHVDNTGDTVNEVAGAGEDTVTTRINYTLAANVEHLVIDATVSTGLTVSGNDLGNGMAGGRLGDVMRGLGGDDIIHGMDGADDLNGGEGQDYLDGGLGRDTLDGGAGMDNLIGGKDADTFVFAGAQVSGATNTAADVIKAGSGAIAFERGLDKIDLSGIDAMLGADMRDDQAFTFGAVVFRRGALQIADQDGMTQIAANVDSDLAAEFVVLIDDGAVSHTVYTASDFIL
jgi:Ca2+-binding RTX toxin-like protein